MFQNKAPAAPVAAAPPPAAAAPSPSEGEPPTPRPDISEDGEWRFQKMEIGDWRRDREPAT